MKCGYPPEYVLDKMETYEVNSALKYSYYAQKDNWEQARLIAYIVAQSNSTRHLKMEDIVKFHWEEDGEQNDTKITKEDIELLKKQAEQYLKSQNKTVEKRDIHG